MPHGLTSTQQPFNNERGSFELLDNLTTTRLFVSFSLFRPAAQWSKIHKFKEGKTCRIHSSPSWANPGCRCQVRCSLVRPPGQQNIPRMCPNSHLACLLEGNVFPVPSLPFQYISTRRKCSQHSLLATGTYSAYEFVVESNSSICHHLRVAHEIPSFCCQVNVDDIFCSKHWQVSLLNPTTVSAITFRRSISADPYACLSVYSS